VSTHGRLLPIPSSFVRLIPTLKWVTQTKLPIVVTTAKELAKSVKALKIPNPFVTSKTSRPNRGPLRTGTLYVPKLSELAEFVECPKIG